MKVRYYSFALNTYKLSKEMTAYFWKDYLLYLPSYNDGSTHSFLMIFGFANGTDFTMDISPHLMDTGSYVSGNDLVTRLLKNLTIDNNIFGYKSTGQIKLTYIRAKDGISLFMKNIVNTIYSSLISTILF